jgi:hypothetical protein
VRLASRHALRLDSMPQQNLFSSRAPLDTEIPSPGGVPGGTRRRSRSPRWMQRLDLIIRVLVRLYLGLILIVLPWGHLWDESRWFVAFPALAHIALSGAARGVVSGLGLLNIFIAVHDTVFYKES